MHITPRIEKVLNKCKSVLQCWDRWLSDCLVEKYGIEPNQMVLCGTVFKSINAVGFEGKEDFWESVSFHIEMYGATSFGLVLGDCLGNAIIFVKNLL